MDGDEDVVTAIEGEGAGEGYAVFHFAWAAGGVEDEVDVVVSGASCGVFSWLQGTHVYVPTGVCEGVSGLFPGFAIFVDIIFHFQKEQAGAAAVQVCKFFAQTECFFSDSFFCFLFQAHGVPSF